MVGAAGATRARVPVAVVHCACAEDYVQEAHCGEGD